MKTLLFIAAIAVLGGCATTQTDMARANAMCAANGGIAKINPKFNNSVTVTCSNTAKFKFSTGN
ncbi:MAG: hypothetical protein DRQ58_12745 [Gammaproteobacteria bacterium]|nr:MAG: hypothetical protein DRQ58_12745 [Gammaproteobacteria bacterium]